MPIRSPASISASLTVILLIVVALVSVLLQMVAVNGAEEQQGLTAMGISLACQSVVILVLATLAARATSFLVRRVSWNSALAVVVTVMLATMIGGTLSFLASILAIPIAGIR